MQQRFSDAQVRGRTDGQKLREALNDAKQYRDEIDIQASSRRKK
jgi:hypothetical protein